MEKRLFTVREIHLLVDELLRAIEYTTEEHVDDTDQKIQAGENEKLTLTVTEAAELIGVCKPTIRNLVLDPVWLYQVTQLTWALHKIGCAFHRSTSPFHS